MSVCVSTTTWPMQANEHGENCGVVKSTLACIRSPDGCQRHLLSSTSVASVRLNKTSLYQGVSAEAMTSFYLSIRFLALLQQLTFNLRAVSADPKVEQCVSLGLISQIANCLDPFIVSHSSLSLRNTCTTDIRGTGEHLDNRRSVCSCPAFFTGTRGLLGCRSLRSQRYREWCPMHLSSIPIHPPRIYTEFCRTASGRRFMSLGGKHSLQWDSV